MGKLGITEKKLLKQYKEAVDEICEYLEEKETFSGQEVCSIVHGILIKNKVKTSLSNDKLYKLYKLYSDELKLKSKTLIY